MLENENLVHLPIDEKWRKVKESIALRIGKNMRELCSRYLADPAVNPYDIALIMAEERLAAAMDDTRRLEADTKRINRLLEEKFNVYTK